MPTNEQITRPRRTISDAALLAAWRAVPPAERHAFTCEALGDDAAEQLLAALDRQQPDEPRPPLTDEELRAVWAAESEANSARGRRAARQAAA